MDYKQGEAKMSALMEQSLEDVEQSGLAGLIVVPAKPTLEMLTRGAAAGEGISVETVWRIWQAMLTAYEEDDV